MKILFGISLVVYGLASIVWLARKHAPQLAAMRTRRRHIEQAFYVSSN